MNCAPNPPAQASARLTAHRPAALGQQGIDLRQRLRVTGPAAAKDCDAG
jgi:hypothetical protein